ncbi:hypothetical protein EKH57_08720 [Halorubrum sp. BOL3-1]|nr:hypothetical protein EKH57_08720 [Halorubrum sp. BOL3-1]
MVDRGDRPFVPDEVPDADLRGLPAGVDLDDHRRAAFAEWQECGPTGAPVGFVAVKPFAARRGYRGGPAFDPDEGARTLPAA